MIDANPAIDSEKELMNSVHKLADAGGSVIQVRTREPLRAALTLRKHLLGSESPYKEWDVVNGFRDFTRENFTEHRIQGKGEDFGEALSFPLAQLRLPGSNVNANAESIHFFVYVDPHPYIKDNPIAIEMLQQYAAILPSTNVCILLVTPDMSIPGVPSGSVLITDLKTPTLVELTSVLKKIVSGAVADQSTFSERSKLTEAEYHKIASMGLGLSLYEFETYVAISIIDASQNGEKKLTVSRLLEGVAKGKTAVVRQSEILSLTHAEEIQNVGGMGRLKDWIAARAGCYSPEAREFGIEPPKGMVLVGVPGTGKSLTARVVASILDVPLVTIDFSRVFSKYVGDSEERIQSALKMVEGMAPVVLFGDEIDKGLGGAGGSNDSGTSSRVLGSFLTWLQDCKAPVFTILTANRVDGLPPELLRRGRFDQIFSVGLPSAAERREVLAIHLRKRGRDIVDFTTAEVNEFLQCSEAYVPAEIESAVKDGLVSAFNDEEAEGLEMRHIIDALKGMVPMSKSHKESIDRMVAWAASHATSVSYPEAPMQLGAAPGQARIIRASRKG